jgi:hypothetical protein
MPYEHIRKALTAVVETARAGAPVANVLVEYENRALLDTQKQSVPYLKFKLHFMDGRNASMGLGARYRAYGNLTLTVAVKEGKGTSESLQMVSYLRPLLHSKVVQGIHLQDASLHPNVPHLGWIYSPLLVPFWYDHAG